MSSRPPVMVRRSLDAPAERVFAAFSDPTLVARWLRPSPEVTLTVLAFDFRVGGSYRFAYDVPDVGRMIVGGVYWVIEAPKRLVFTWVIEPPDEHAGIMSEVTIAITARGTQSDLVVSHDKFDRADAEQRHAQGWQGALDHLVSLLKERE